MLNKRTNVMHKYFVFRSNVIFLNINVHTCRNPSSRGVTILTTSYVQFTRSALNPNSENYLLIDNTTTFKLYLTVLITWLVTREKNFFLISLNLRRPFLPLFSILRLIHKDIVSWLPQKSVSWDNSTGCIFLYSNYVLAQEGLTLRIIWR